MDMFDIIFFRTGIIFLFTASLFDKPKREIPREIMLILASLLILSLANLFIYTFHPNILHEQMNLFLGVLGICILYIYLDEKQSLKKPILWAGIINLFYYTLQKIGFNPAFNQMPYIGQEGSFLGNQPRLMIYFALIAPFFNLWGVIPAIFLGIFTQQISIFSSVALLLFSKLKFKRERLEFIVLLILAVILLKDKIIQSLIYRFNFSWKPLLTVYFLRPLIGFGMGVRPTKEIVEVGYCSYLQFIIGTGFFGALWFGYVFKVFYKKIRMNVENVAMISLAILMLIEYPLEIVRLRYTIMGIIIMFLFKIKENEKTV